MKRVRLVCTCQEISPAPEPEFTVGKILPEKGQAVRDNGLKILVFGATPPCATCRQAEQEACRAAQRYPAGRVRVEHHDAHSEVARAYGVALTPTIVVGDRKFSGKVLPAEEMIPIIDSFLHL